jgi:hypothetical protein
VRFDHRAAYPAYLFALATRLAYLRLAHGSGGLTAPGIASELRLHAAPLDWLRSHLEAAEIAAGGGKAVQVIDSA